MFVVRLELIEQIHKILAYFKRVEWANKTAVDKTGRQGLAELTASTSC